MAVEMRTEGVRRVSYFGRVEDVKLLSGIASGAIHHYIDTGEDYIFFDGMWEPDLRNEESYRRNILYVF